MHPIFQIGLGGIIGLGIIFGINKGFDYLTPDKITPTWKEIRLQEANSEQPVCSVYRKWERIEARDPYNSSPYLPMVPAFWQYCDDNEKLIKENR